MGWSEKIKSEMFQTEEYSHDDINKFNTCAGQIPCWLLDWMADQGYLIGDLQPAHYMDFCFFTLGKLWSDVGSLTKSGSHCRHNLCKVEGFPGETCPWDSKLQCFFSAAAPFLALFPNFEAVAGPFFRTLWVPYFEMQAMVYHNWGSRPFLRQVSSFADHS